MKRLMVKLGLVVLAAGTLGGVAAPSAASASTKAKPATFTNTDLKRYYKNASSKTAFYFKSYKSNGKTGTLLIFASNKKTPAAASVFNQTYLLFLNKVVR